MGVFCAAALIFTVGIGLTRLRGPFATNSGKMTPLFHPHHLNGKGILMPKSLLLDEVRKVIRLLHYSIRTEEAYVQTIRRFILYHHKRHPRDMGVDEIRQYLSHLATDGNVAASTQNVALCALLFLYRQVLEIDLPLIENVERAKRPKRVPVVFTPGEVRRVLANIHGTHLMMASLLYGAGLRLMECVRLRVKDLDFQYKQITADLATTMIYTHVLNKGGKGVKSPLEL